MLEKRRQYTEEFKREAVRMVTERGYSVNETARDLGINAKMLGRWQRQARQSSNGAFAVNGHRTAEHAELARLRKEVKRLTMEREILKKTVSFFASESSESRPLLLHLKGSGRYRYYVRSWP
jgi:transposase